MDWILKIQKKEKRKNRKESHKPENKGPNIVNVSTSSKKMMYGSKVSYLPRNFLDSIRLHKKRKSKGNPFWGKIDKDIRYYMSVFCLRGVPFSSFRNGNKQEKDKAFLSDLLDWRKKIGKGV